MTRYIILGQDKKQWLWDSKNKKMFEKTSEGIVSRPTTLQMLVKFKPYVEVVEETDKMPDGWDFDLKEKNEGK